MVACESEFYLLRREAGKLAPFSGEELGDQFCETRGYDVLNDYVHELVRSLEMMSVQVQGLKKEYSPSQIEVILRYADALKAADGFVTLREAAKGIAANRGLLASFLPKPFETMASCGLHLHVSLFERDSGKNAFFDAKDTRSAGLSKLGYHFIGGIMRHVKAMTALTSPLPNSYKRLIPSPAWAPAYVCYGYDNRAAAIRIPSRPHENPDAAARIEFRVPDPTANPYLAIGITLAAGMVGVRERLDPGQPLEKDPTKLSQAELRNRHIEELPSTLGDALREMDDDPFVRQSLGDVLYAEYSKARQYEWRVFREKLTEWEVRTYIGSF
jgi:glutamine synthetase